MNYNDFEEVVTKLYEIKNKKQKYIDKIPYDIRQAVWDNEFHSLTENTIEFLLEKYLGEYHQDFNWFYYELSDTVKAYKENGDSPNTISHGREYWIHDLDSYLEYAKKELFNNGLKNNI